MTKSTSGGGDQFETSPEAIEPELRTALCERRQTDRLKTNYSIDCSVYRSWNKPDFALGDHVRQQNVVVLSLLPSTRVRPLSMS